MKTFIRILLWLWQFPQNIIGFVMSLIWRETVTRDVEMKDGIEKDVRFYMYPYNSVSLGNYRFIRHNSGDLTYRHEMGHSIDSRRWGIFYLLVIGLPSAIRNLIWRTPYGKTHDYYAGWPENSADRNAGIER